MKMPDRIKTPRYEILISTDVPLWRRPIAYIGKGLIRLGIRLIVGCVRIRLIKE